MTLTLQTPRLELRQFTPADFDVLLALYSNPEVMALHPVGPMSRPQVEGVLAHILHTYDDPGYGFFAVVERGTGAVIGQCGLLDQQIAGRAEVELAFKLFPAYWGRGLMTEAARRVRDYGLGERGFSRLIAIVHPENHASRRVCEKIGMVREQEASWHGLEHMQVYSIVRSNERQLL